MKKILSILWMGILVIGLTACGNTKSEKENDEVENNNVEPPKQSIIEENLLSKDFKCSAIDDNTITKMNYQNLLLDNGKVYSYVLNDELYSNDEQCKEFSDISIKRAHDGYYLGNDNTVYVISDNKFEKFNIESMQTVEKELLYDDNLITYGYGRITEEDGYPVNEFGYTKSYVLKPDGKIYYRFYKYSESNAWSPITLLKETLWEKSEQFGKISEFKVEDGAITMVISDKGLYYLKDVETEECLKDEDIECEKDYVKSNLYDEYKDQIKYINNEYTIFKNNNIIRTYLFTGE